MFELLYYLIGIAVRVGIKKNFSLHVNGLENYSETPSTLIVANHKRDLDSVLLASVFYFRNGFLHPAHPVSFMGDENLFQPGFLGNWIKGPGILKKVLQPFSLGYVLRGVHAYPIGKLDFRSVPVHDALRIIRETNGDHRLNEIIKEEALQDLLGDASFGHPDMTITEFFDSEGYPRKKIKSNCFKSSFRKAVKKTKLFGVRRQLDTFIDLLDEGEIIYITPEGALSRNGMLGKLKDSLLILLDEANTDVVVTPTNITYDYLTDGRTNIFVNVGEEIEGLSGTDRKEQSDILRRRILKLTTVNLGQLTSYYLVNAEGNGREVVEEEKFCSKVREYLEKARDAGFHVDENLQSSQGFEERWRGYINYCEDREVLRRVGNGRFRLNDGLGYDRTEIPRGYRRKPVDYSANEIKDLEKVGLLDL
ncbi:MAG: 1-acyl-sn-glycerol-3-phosphate acyltransferase [Candidatus Bipolaricaulota bacterium]